MAAMAALSAVAAKVTRDDSYPPSVVMIVALFHAQSLASGRYIFLHFGCLKR